MKHQLINGLIGRIAVRQVIGGKYDCFLATEKSFTGWEPDTWTRVFYDKKERTVKHLSGVQRKPLFYVAVANLLSQLTNGGK